jgi:hypothetical protein
MIGSLPSGAHVRLPPEASQRKELKWTAIGTAPPSGSKPLIYSPNPPNIFPEVLAVTPGGQVVERKVLELADFIRGKSCGRRNVLVAPIIKVKGEVRGMKFERVVRNNWRD